MNIKTKFLLSVMMVSLSALVVPLKGWGENLETEPLAVQSVVKSKGVNIENFIKEQPVSINFEFYLMCLRVTYTISTFKM